MSELTYIEDGFDHGQMLAGITEAAANYQALSEEIGPDALLRRGGLTHSEREAALRLNQDVFVADALRIPEDTQAIMSTEGYQATAPEYIEPQYALDAFVGEQVARNLFAVVNSAEARDILPDKTVALIEVNANRGFPRDNEDSLGCYGLPSDWLGHVAVDLDYRGADDLSRMNLERVTIDYLQEAGNLAFSRRTIERNAARIRIRPARPIETRDIESMWPMPRDVYEKRAGLSDEEVAYVRDEWAVLRGEYRICRAVCILHDLTDWSAEDFMSKEQAFEDFKKELASHYAPATNKPVPGYIDHLPPPPRVRPAWLDQPLKRFKPKA